MNDLYITFLRFSKRISIAKRTNNGKTSSMASQILGKMDWPTAEKINAKEWMRLE